MKVLYLEDDPRDADVTARVLHKTAPHIELETVSTVHEGLARLERLAEEPLDMVLTDVNLRDGDGLEFLKHIRENALSVAVVVVTGLGDEETEVAALKARADEYVVKERDYLDGLHITLESAYNHYCAAAARRAHPLNVLYAEVDALDIHNTRRHFAIHADHIRIDVVSSVSALRQEKAKSNYDVLLLNFDLPERSALELLRELRHRNELDLPVVLVCREVDKALARQGLKLGATSCVVKSPGYLHQLSWELEEAHSRAELVRREAALQESEERFRSLADTAPVLIWLTGPDKRCTYVNRPWLEFTGRTIEQELGHGWVESVHPDDQERCFQTYVNAFDERRSLKMEYRLRYHDGEYHWVLDTGVPRFTADGSFIGYVGSAVDITERKETEASLEKALTELQVLKDRLHDENVYLQEEIRVASNFGEIIGQSEALERVLKLAEQVAPLDTTVLILGETGTGKELLAHAIHSRSPRQNHALVKVNCATLPADLIESELFGHEKGAFTGASSRRLGRFELADGGTIFLDEIGELPFDLQAKLLRVLQEGEFDPIGSTRTMKVDVRVIAATNRNLEEAVHENLFRSDLYYRLGVFPITLPPLRERPKDTQLLVKHFVAELSRKFGKLIDVIPHETMTALKSYPWPGNIRELRNVIERAVIITQGPRLLLDSFELLKLQAAPPATVDVRELSNDLDMNRKQTLEESQYNLILHSLKNSYWRIEGPYGAAAALKIHPSKLRSLMKKLGINRPQVKTQSSGMR